MGFGKAEDGELLKSAECQLRGRKRSAARWGGDGCTDLVSANCILKTVKRVSSVLRILQPN